ncbi:MAG: GNAT family N-acetyltransferase, partial [Nitrospirae bacterium]|nr:GNAT family N-acetyltransferase [Nitrospirota bacterium]
DPDHADAEYAVLVADPWQGKGLGILLTEYCEEIARSWEIRRITAETSAGNQRMLATFRHRGFVLEPDPASDVVFVRKSLE